MKERIIVVCTILLAVGYLFATFQLPVLQNVDFLGPRVFPALLGTGMIISAVLLILELIFKKGKIHKPDQSLLETRAQLLLVGGVALGTLIFFMFLKSLGFLVSSTIYLLAFMAYFNRGKWFVNTIVAILFSIGSYALFVKALGNALPKGILSF